MGAGVDVKAGDAPPAATLGCYTICELDRFHKSGLDKQTDHLTVAGLIVRATCGLHIGSVRACSLHRVWPDVLLQAPVQVCVDAAMLPRRSVLEMLAPAARDAQQSATAAQMPLRLGAAPKAPPQAAPPCGGHRQHQRASVRTIQALTSGSGQHGRHRCTASALRLAFDWNHISHPAATPRGRASCQSDGLEARGIWTRIINARRGTPGALAHGLCCLSKQTFGRCSR